MIHEYYDIFDKDEYQYIISAITSDRWEWGHKSNKNHPEDKKKLFWAMNLLEDTMFTGHFFDKIKKITNTNCILSDVYANGQTYGLDGAWHQDASEYTFLYYANPVWDIKWGGETIFAVEDQIKTYYPKPNKALLFPGKLWHYGKSPSRDFYDLRVTIAFKLELLGAGGLTDPAACATIVR